VGVSRNLREDKDAAGGGGGGRPPAHLSLMGGKKRCPRVTFGLISVSHEDHADRDQVTGVFGIQELARAQKPRVRGIGF